MKTDVLIIGGVGEVAKFIAEYLNKKGIGFAETKT